MAPWLSYPDPEGWARAWLAERHPQPVVEAERCDYVSARDGRRCVRKPHDSSNHSLEPKQDVEDSEGSDVSDNQPSSPPDGAMSDPSDEPWDDQPPGVDSQEPLL